MQEILSKAKVGSRIRQLRLKKMLSQEEVSNLLGLSRSNYSQIELGNQFPSYKTLIKLAIFYHKQYEWILHGWEVNGSDDIAQTENKLDTVIPSALHIPLTEEISFVKNSDYEHYVTLRADENYIKQLETVRIPGFQNSCSDDFFRSFEIVDSGMTPMLHPGDIVTGKNVANLRNLILGDGYVIVTNKELLIRRIMRCVENDTLLLCQSDNPNFHVSIIAIEEIQELWHLRGIFSTKLRGVVEEMGQKIFSL